MIKPFSRLPDCVSVEGKNYNINTDFRTWAELYSFMESSATYEQKILKLLLDGYTNELPPHLDSAVKALLDFMVLYNLLGGAISFAEPSGIFQEYLILTVHSCIWHMLLVFIGLFLCFSKRGGAEKWSYGSATWVFLTLCEIAFLLNSAVQLGLGENMNMFFVGPGNSPIIVFKQISEQFGWFINTPIYIFAVCLGAYLVFYLIQRISTCFDTFEPDPSEFTK